MRILIVEASLKAVNKPSNTRVLCRVAKEALEREGADVIIRSLKGMKYDFSTTFAADDGGADDMTALLKSVIDMDAVVLATPIWWGIHSSLAQSFIERMDDFDDWANEKNINPMMKKAFATIVSGNSDGFQHIHGIHNAFASYLGFTVPPRSMLESTIQDAKKLESDKELEEKASKWAKNIVRCINQLN